MGGTVNLTLLSLLTAVISHSIFFLFVKVMKTLSWSFSFAIWANGNAKKYICGTLPFTALEVNPTMTTSAAENPGNVIKKRYIHNSPRVCWRIFLVENTPIRQHLNQVVCFFNAGPAAELSNTWQAETWNVTKAETGPCFPDRLRKCELASDCWWMRATGRSPSPRMARSPATLSSQWPMKHTSVSA